MSRQSAASNVPVGMAARADPIIAESNRRDRPRLGGHFADGVWDGGGAQWQPAERSGQVARQSAQVNVEATQDLAAIGMGQAIELEWPIKQLNIGAAALFAKCRGAVDRGNAQ
ncbi:hypothetical protein [Mesorhizobium sp. 128a]